MLRRLLGLAVFALVGWLLGRLIGEVRGHGSRRTGRGRSEVPRSEGTMVRDRVCNTFLPRSKALELEVDGERHFFCSERCREIFQARIESA